MGFLGALFFLILFAAVLGMAALVALLPLILSLTTLAIGKKLGAAKPWCTVTVLIGIVLTVICLILMQENGSHVPVFLLLQVGYAVISVIVLLSERKKRADCEAVEFVSEDDTLSDAEELVFVGEETRIDAIEVEVDGFALQDFGIRLRGNPMCENGSLYLYFELLADRRTVQSLPRGFAARLQAVVYDADADILGVEETVLEKRDLASGHYAGTLSFFGVMRRAPQSVSLFALDETDYDV